MTVIHEKFLVVFNLLRGPDITRFGAGFAPWASGCAFLVYWLSNPFLNLTILRCY